MNRFHPSFITAIMMNDLHRNKWEPAMILPPSKLLHLPVKTGVTRERDNTSEFAEKCRKLNRNRRPQHVLGGYAVDSDIS